MIEYKYKIGDIVNVKGLGKGVIEDYQISRIDNKDIPSYWVKYDKKIHPDEEARNTYESSISKIYTMNDALDITCDIEVLHLPKRVYCDNENTLKLIAHRFSECHIGTSINWKELFIQT